MKFEALVMAGGKGSRMGICDIEKPMQIVGGKHTVMRVVEALSNSPNISRVLVSVSDNTQETEKYLRDMGVEVLKTSGDDFMEDMHTAFSVMNGDYILTCPSDLPLLQTYTVDAFIGYFKPEMESAIAVVDEETVVNTGIKPSFTIDIEGKKWVLSGLCISDRQKTLDGFYLNESYMMTDWVDLAINVNTPEELALSRGIMDSPSMIDKITRCGGCSCTVCELPQEDHHR